MEDSTGKIRCPLSACDHIEIVPMNELPVFGDHVDRFCEKCGIGFRVSILSVTLGTSIRVKLNGWSRP